MMQLGSSNQLLTLTLGYVLSGSDIGDQHHSKNFCGLAKFLAPSIRKYFTYVV